MKKLFKFATPLGLFIYIIYMIGNRLIGKFPDIIAYPMLIIGVVLLLIGIIYHGYCLGKGENPYYSKQNK